MKIDTINTSRMREHANAEALETKQGIGILKDIVRIGTVSSVDVENRTARVIFPDKKDLPSGELKVLQNQPLITVEKSVDGSGWSYDAAYASVDRGLGLGESYTKAAPDTIRNTKSIDYQCPLHGIDETKTHEQLITVYPWLPYIGQLVLCLYLPYGEGDGFVLGGI